MPIAPAHVLDIASMTASAVSQKKVKAPALEPRPHTHVIDTDLTRL